MGSLFQLRDYWYTSFPGEEFSASAVTTGDIDNTNTNLKVAIGSFQGQLRLLNPSSERGEMRPRDLLFEKKYEEPILQLQCGPFEPIVENICRNLLAILFPRRLIMLSVECRGEVDTTRDTNDGNLGIYYEFVHHFETTFDSCTYNFTTGYFGGSRSLMLCVQTMDGQLTVMDHNKVIFRRYLSSDQFLLPGCLKYCNEKHYFLTNNSSMFLMCYNYNTLVNSKDAEEKDTLKSLTTAADESEDDSSMFPKRPASRISPAWAFNVGDDVVQIEICSLTRGCAPNDKDIVVLCPYNIQILTLNGERRMVRRLDVESSCLHYYPIPGCGVDNLMVGCLNGLVNFYSDVSLEWSAKLPQGHPVQIRSGELCGTKGMLLVLDSDSRLSVNYLGTDPAENPIQPLESQAALYSDMAEELKRVMWDIKEFERTGGDDDIKKEYTGGTDEGDVIKGDIATEIAPPVAAAALGVGVDTPVAAVVEAKPSKKLLFNVELSFQLQDTNLSNKDSEINRVSLNLKVTLHADAAFDLEDGLTVQLQSVAPVEVETAHFEIPALQRGQSVDIPVVVTAKNDRDSIFPSSVELRAVALYKGKRRESLVSTASFNLPLCLVLYPVPPVKCTGFSMQLNTNKPTPPSLLELFSEMTHYEYITVNVLSIRYVNGEDATILVSKNASRFKLQASTLEALWLLSSELIRRLKLFYGEGNEENGSGGASNDVFSSGDLVFEIPNDPPLVDFLAVVQTHMSIRKELNESYKKLEKAAEFFRAMQKRLLARFRDSNPSNMDAVEALFTESYRNLQTATDGVNFSRSRQRQACAMLNCCARLLYTWVAIRFQDTLPANDRRFLRGILCCDISDDNGVGWEEITEAALGQVLDNKRALNKQLEVNYSVQTLKKSITAAFDRVRAGKPLIVAKPSMATAVAVPPPPQPAADK